MCTDISFMIAHLCFFWKKNHKEMLLKRFKSKIEKIPRGNQGEKSGKTSNFEKNCLNNRSISKSPKNETEPGVRKGKPSLLSCHTRCECSILTTRNSVKNKLSIKVMKVVESLICWEVTVTGQGSECHLTFGREIYTSYC